MAGSSARKRWLLPCSCFGALLLVVSLALIPLVLASRSRLTIVGKRVADAAAWQRSYDGYYWDSNRTQIVANTVPSTTMMRLDDFSGKLTVAAPWIAAQASAGAPADGTRPSPDGKWLLLRPKRASDFIAFETSTHRTVRWKATSQGLLYTLWFPDSKRWVEFDRSANGQAVQPVLHSLEGPDRKAAPIPIASIWPVGTRAPSHVITAINGEHPELWDYDLDSNLIAPQKHAVGFPQGRSVYEVEGSPDGTRVAYLVQEETGSYITRLLDRLLPHHDDPGNIYALWVSRSDGSELHRIGFEKANDLAGLQWSPDGKRLSFFLNEGFYIAPAD